LQQIAEILEVSPEALKTLDIDSAINVIGNTFNNNSSPIIQHQPLQSTINQTFNSPLDKLIELFTSEKAELRKENEQLKKELEKLKSGKK